MSFKDLYRISPPELKQIVIDQWKAKQNPTHHPEGNTLKHIIVVTNRAFRDFPDNKDIQLAAYFHDLGKLATYDINPKTGQPTAYGHEVESSKLIDEFSSFIKQQGANPEIVKYIVINHMKIKPSTWDVMKPTKKDPIINDPSYQDLEKFGTIDKGGLLESIYLYSNNKNMPQLINEAKRFQKLANIREAEEQSTEMTPEEAAKKAASLSREIENNSKIQQVADKIAADPKAKEELKKLLDKYQFSLNESESGIQNLALVFAKKAETVKEEMDYGGSFLTGLIGGGTLAHYLFSVTTSDFVGGLTHSTAALPETLIGAAIGAILAIIGKKVYDKSKGIEETVNEALRKFRKGK
jgi:hypothetical protein